jgi:hypothetical protein
VPTRAPVRRPVEVRVAPSRPTPAASRTVPKASGTPVVVEATDHDLQSEQEQWSTDQIVDEELDCAPQVEDLVVDEVGLSAIDLGSESAGRLAARAAGERLLSQYALAGAAEGLRGALAYGDAAERAEQEGYRAGMSNAGAVPYGRWFGSQRATERAAVDARAAVERMFADLTREPRAVADSAPPVYQPPDEIAPDSDLEIVMRSFATSPPSQTAITLGYDMLYRDPWRLYRLGVQGDLVDESLSNPDDAYRDWVRRGGRNERAVDRASFADGFASELAIVFDTVFDPAFDSGYSAGWQRGGEIAVEWRYRMGESRGLAEGVGGAAASVWSPSYVRTNTAVFNQTFDEWMSSARPKIEAMWLEDDDGDGRITMGDGVSVCLLLANFGGRPASLEIRLDSPSLLPPEAWFVDLPARRRLRAAVCRPVAVLDPGGQPTVSLVTARVGAESRSAALVLHP